MFIYNVTIQVIWEKHVDWLRWMQQEHIPAVMATNCFIDSKLLILHEVDDTEGPTYITQYFATGKAQYNRYVELYATALRKETAEKWGNSVFAFRTLLEVIE
ncbi:MAG: DUF4286 family protein [Bacteroidetes bacterium]|nr:DUF4286 family protein [Bacteroidota bacterium]